MGLKGTVPLALGRGTGDQPDVLFVRFVPVAGAGLHPRDRPLPFAPVFSGALLEKEGFGASLIELPSRRKISRRIINVIKAHPGVLAFEINAGQMEWLRALVSSLNGAQARAVAAYGVQVNALADSVLESGLVDFCAMGEAESVLPRFVPWALSGMKGKAPPGLKWMENGVVRDSGDAQLLNSDDVPFIPLSVLRSGRYEKNSFPVSIGRPLRWGFILANRGCLFSCNFCTGMTRQSPLREYRLCLPSRLFEEMKYQIDEGGRTIISIEDDLFTGSRAWTMEFCDLLAAEKWKYPWIMQTRFDCLDRELALALKQAGCVGITCGLESGSDKVLKALNKRTTSAAIKATGKTLNDLGFATRYTTMIGAPGESATDFEATAALVKELNPLIVQTSFCTAFPDTGLAVGADAFEKLRRFEAPSRNLCKMEPEELKRRRLAFYRQYYFSLKYARTHVTTWLRYGLLNPGKAVGQIAGFMLFLTSTIFRRTAPSDAVSRITEASAR